MSTSTSTGADDGGGGRLRPELPRASSPEPSSSITTNRFLLKKKPKKRKYTADEKMRRKVERMADKKGSKFLAIVEKICCCAAGTEKMHEFRGMKYAWKLHKAELKEQPSYMRLRRQQLRTVSAALILLVSASLGFFTGDVAVTLGGERFWDFYKWPERCITFFPEYRPIFGNNSNFTDIADLRMNDTSQTLQENGSVWDAVWANWSENVITRPQKFVYQQPVFRHSEITGDLSMDMIVDQPYMNYYHFGNNESLTFEGARRIDADGPLGWKTWFNNDVNDRESIVHQAEKTWKQIKHEFCCRDIHSKPWNKCRQSKKAAGDVPWHCNTEVAQTDVLYAQLGPSDPFFVNRLAEVWGTGELHAYVRGWLHIYGAKVFVWSIEASTDAKNAIARFFPPPYSELGSPCNQGFANRGARWQFNDLFHCLNNDFIQIVINQTFPKTGPVIRDFTLTIKKPRMETEALANLCNLQRGSAGRNSYAVLGAPYSTEALGPQNQLGLQALMAVSRLLRDNAFQ